MIRRYFRVAIAALSVSLLPSAYPQTVSAIHPSTRIVSPINNSELVSLKGDVSPIAQARFDRGEAPTSQPTGPLFLLLRRSAAQQQALTEYLQDLQNPSSPDYHHWLTPQEYGSEFGASNSDVQTIESWLTTQGFHVMAVSPARNMIQFSGNFSQVQGAFHTSIHIYAFDGKTHYANISDPQIPAALAPVVAGVGPLNNFYPTPAIQRGPRGKYDPTTDTIRPELTLFTSTNLPVLYVDPADAAVIYDAPNKNLNPNYSSGTTYDGAGVNIGIVGDSNISLQDIQNYRTAFLGESATAANLPTVVVDGNDPGLNGDELEGLLDNEVAGGLAPGAKIYFYTSANTDLSSGLFNAIQRAIDDNTVSILSVSYGLCEAQLGSTGNQILNAMMEQAAAQGITVTVSSGDSGSAGCDNFDTESQAADGFAVSGLASSPWDTAVGGTDFYGLPSAFTLYATDSSIGSPPYYLTAKGYIPEQVWNDSSVSNSGYSSNAPYKGSNGQTNIIAGSGGVSQVYSKPAYQLSLTPADGKRDLPDVSLLAGNGFYDAVWVVCADNVADGITNQTFADCQNSSGTFSGSTTFTGIGGTSAATPVFAGILALVEQKTGSRLGTANVILYQLAQSKYGSVFHDVTVGNNSVYCQVGSPDCGSNDFLTGYNATAGYDLASGLGSVDISALVNDWNTVSLSSTSTSLTINGSTTPLTAVHGTSLNFSVGVSPSSATGIVGVIDTANETSGGTSSGLQNDGQFTIPLTSGSGSASYNGLPGGSYTVSARYGGDTSNASSTSSPISVTITPESSTTSLTVNAENPQSGASIANLSSIPYGSAIYMNAKITGAAEGASTEGIATGTVTFLNGGGSLGTENVGGGNAADYPVPGTPATFPIGTQSISARYSGDASFDASTSGVQSFTVVPATTTTTVSANPVSFNANTQVGITVDISTPANLGSTPTGTLTVTTGGTTLFSTSTFNTITQQSGSTSYTVLTATGYPQSSQFNSGSDVVSATYSGDSNYAPSSGTTTVTNTAGIGSFALANSGDVTVTAGQTGNVTLTVTPSGGFESPINFTCTTYTAGECGMASVNVTGTSAVSTSLSLFTNYSAPPGTYPITVTGTDATGKITAQTTFNLVVNGLPSNAGFSLSAVSPITTSLGASPYDQITLTPNNGFIGYVNVSCTVKASTTSQTSPPTCITTQMTVSGSAPITENANILIPSSTSTGNYTLAYTATDANDSNITASATATLTVASQESFALTNSGNVTIAPGATTGNASSITVTPSGGYTGYVDLTCTLTSTTTNNVIPPGCTVPPSVYISGNSGVTATATISSTAPSTAAAHPTLREAFFAGGGTLFACLLFFGVPARRRLWRNILGVLAICTFISFLGCGGGSVSSSTGGGGGGGGVATGTTPGTYTFTVTGTDSSNSQRTSTTTVTVSVT